MTVRRRCTTPRTQNTHLCRQTLSTNHKGDDSPRSTSTMSSSSGTSLGQQARADYPGALYICLHNTPYRVSGRWRVSRSGSQDAALDGSDAISSTIFSTRLFITSAFCLPISSTSSCDTCGSSCLTTGFPASFPIPRQLVLIE